MEITLEKIELVKDRTGVSYKEAKEALEAAEGSVVDAIIKLEENVDINKGGSTSEFVGETVDKVKELVKKGNVSKIAVKKDDETIVNIPVNVGVVGAIVAPWGVIAAAIAAVGFKCRVELTTTEGKVIDVTKRAEGLATDVREKSSVVFDGVIEKGSVVVNSVKEKAPDVMNDVKEKSTDAYNTIKDAAAEKYGEFKAKKENTVCEAEETADKVKEAAEDAMEDAAEIFDDICEKTCDALEDVAEAAEEAVETVKEKTSKFWGIFGKKKEAETEEAVCEEVGSSDCDNCEETSCDGCEQAEPKENE